MLQLNVILEGILLGLTLSILLGPAFFCLMQASIERGFWAGASIAWGMLLADIILVLLAYLGATQFLQLSQNKTSLGVIGGVVIIAFGCASIFSKVDSQEIQIEQFDYFKLGLKGFLINSTNPFVWLFWLGVAGAVDSKYSFARQKVWTFLCCVLLTTLSIDFLKAYIAGKLKKILNEIVIAWINAIAGIALVTFGIGLIWKVLTI